MAEDVIREPFAAINVDDFYGADSFNVLGQQLQSGSAGAYLGYILAALLALLVLR